MSVLWAYGLQREVELLADPGLDAEGAALTFDVGEKRVKVRKGHAVCANASTVSLARL